MTSSRVRIPAAPRSIRRPRLVGLAGRGPDLVAAGRQDRDGHGAHAARRPGHEHGSVTGPQAALLEGLDAHRGGEPGGADRHRVARRQAVRQRHDPARRDPCQLAVPAVARGADVVAVGQDARPGRERIVLRGHHRAGEVDAGDQRVDPGHAAVLARRESVLEVDAGPLDADRHLPRRQVRRRERPETTREGAALGLVDDVGAERIGQVSACTDDARAWRARHVACRRARTPSGSETPTSWCGLPPQQVHSTHRRAYSHGAQPVTIPPSPVDAPLTGGIE